jgi:C-terminal processing protease CtpA/Prc
LKILLILFITCISLTSFGQNDSQKNYLVCYGQVWGFLKYFHSAPSNQDWDSLLLSDYNEINNCDSDLEFNRVISKLVNQCDEFKPVKRNTPDSLIFQESFDWLDNKLIDSKNKSVLENLLLNKPSFKNKYITSLGAGHPKITNEIDYGSYQYNPSVQYLSITRYWNIINYFCPNRNIIPKNWTQVYHDNILDFTTANTYENYYFAVRKLTTEIRDGHGFIRAENNPINNYKYAPFYCISVSDGYFINAVFQDSLKSIDLKRMDKIISINGEPVEEKIRQIGTYLSTSNDYYLSNATHYLRITNQDSMTITIERDGELVTRTYSTIDREALKLRFKPSKSIPAKKPYSFLKDSISGKEYCYVDMGRLKRSDIGGKFKRKLLSTDHLILDVRNYPNWTLIKLSAVLLEGPRKFAKFVAMDCDYPGSFKWTKSQTIGNKKKGYEGDVFVLVEYNTMSQAEYTVMALQQHPNTVVIGGQTAGADGNIAEIPLPFGIRSVFSGLGVFYPDGTPTQQIGVERDFEVVQSSEYLMGKDLILEKALELIRIK